MEGGSPLQVAGIRPFSAAPSGWKSKGSHSYECFTGPHPSARGWIKCGGRSPVRSRAGHPLGERQTLKSCWARRSSPASGAECSVRGCATSLAGRVL